LQVGEVSKRPKYISIKGRGKLTEGKTPQDGYCVKLQETQVTKFIRRLRYRTKGSHTTFQEGLGTKLSRKLRYKIP
jgi:hypothetical protein